MDIATITALSKLLFDGLAVIIIMILYIKSNKKRQEENDQDRADYKRLNEDIQNNYNAMIQDIIKGVAGKHLTPEESKGIAKIDKQINETITDMLKELGASRVCVVKYHNGNKDMTGKSFLKMSMTNEVVNIGVAPMMSDFKDIFRSLLVYWCNKIEIEKECLIKDTEEMKDIDITMYQYLTARHIESKYGLALTDVHKNVIGFMCIEYLNKNDFDNEKVNKVMKEYFPRLQALISIDGGIENEL